MTCRGNLLHLCTSIICLPVYWSDAVCITNSAKNSSRLSQDVIPRLSPRHFTPFELEQIRQHSRR